MVQGIQSIQQNLISKITNTERDGNMAQVIESLPSKPEVLSSNLSTTKKKK
jgi:hypothetical protein